MGFLLRSVVLVLWSVVMIFGCSLGGSMLCVRSVVVVCGMV